MDTILRAIVGYCVLLLVMRLLPRRPGGQLTLFEFVIIILVGGVAIAATVGEDHSVTNCTIAILTIASMHRLMSKLRAWAPRAAVLLDGIPLLLIKDGHWQSEIMRGMRVDREDVMAAARGKQVKSIRAVKYAILERNGSITIIPTDR